jgi:Na+/H+ antiporter NhaA
VNAGIDLRKISLYQMTGNVPVGIMLGLFILKTAIEIENLV